MYFHDTNFLNYQFFQKYIELYWIIYFVFFKNIDIEYFFTNKKFKTYLISCIV